MDLIKDLRRHPVLISEHKCPNCRYSMLIKNGNEFVFSDVRPEEVERMKKEVMKLKIEEIEEVKKYCDKVLANSGYYIAKYYNDEKVKEVLKDGKEKESRI